MLVIEDCAVLCLVAQSRLILCDPVDCGPPGSSVHGDSPGWNTRMGCHVLLQGIFPTQESNPGLPHCRRILYHLRHQGSPWRLVWIAYPFSRGSSRPRNPTRVSCTAGGFLTSWAAREALLKISHIFYYLNSKCFYLPFRKLFCLENCRRYSNEIKKKKKTTEKVWNIFSTWANGKEPVHQSGFVNNFIKTTSVSLGLHWDMPE